MITGWEKQLTGVLTEHAFGVQSLRPRTLLTNITKQLYYNFPGPDPLLALVSVFTPPSTAGKTEAQREEVARGNTP